MKKFVYTLTLCCLVGLVACQQEAKQDTSNKLSSPTPTKTQNTKSTNKVSKTLDFKGGSKVNFRGQQLAEKYCKCNKRKSNKEVCKSDIQYTFDKVYKRISKDLQAGFKKSFDEGIAKCK